MTLAEDKLSEYSVLITGRYVDKSILFCCPQYTMVCHGLIQGLSFYSLSNYIPEIFLLVSPSILIFQDQPPKSAKACYQLPSFLTPAYLDDKEKCIFKYILKMYQVALKKKRFIIHLYFAQFKRFFLLCSTQDQSCKVD